MGKKELLLDKLQKAIMEGDKGAASDVAKEILTSGIDPVEAIQKGAVKGLDIVGEKYQCLDAFLPELIMAGDAMKECMQIFGPHIKSDRIGEVQQVKVVIGTVFGDVHDIGKNLVGAMLSVTGFDVYDLGINVRSKAFIEKAEEIGAKAIALSALLSTSAYYQEEVIKYLKDMGLREKYYVAVGGGPMTPEWAIQMGADGYGETAIDASRLLKRLVTEGGQPPIAKPIIVGREYNNT